MKPQPVVFIWRSVDIVDSDGVATRVMAMVAHPRYDNIANRQFAEGGDYTLAPVEERSMASHSQFFASMNEYYNNLPEKIAARWPSAQHFRKWCLCETGWFDEKEFELATQKHAKLLATFIRTDDDYARIAIRGTTVIVRRARSQSLAAMGKADFQASKQAVLELAEQFVGVSPKTMMKEAGHHA